MVMEDSETADDDFFGAGDEGSKIQGTSALMTVVDMPSADPIDESENADCSEDEAVGMSHDETEEDSETLNSSRDDHLTPRGANGHYPSDLAPPDILLMRTEKKISRYLENKQTEKVIPELIRCTVLAQLVYSKRHWRVARAHTKLASAYFDLKGYTAQAIYHIETAEGIMRNQEIQPEDYSTDQRLIYSNLVEMYFTLGRALTAVKKFSEADTALSQCEKILQELSVMPLVVDTDLEDWSIKLNLALGRLNFRMKKFALSVTYFENALDLMQKKYGANSEQLISVYQSLGRVEQGKGKQADHLRAIEHFLQAHSIASASYSDDSVEVAETANAVALAYTNVGDEDAENSAESYFNQALNTYESLYGSGCEKALEIKDELARLMIRTDRIDEAITLMQSTLPLKQDTYGDFSKQVADTLKLIGNSYLSIGEAEKALQLMKKCHSVECTLYGENSQKPKETQKTIDMLLANPNLAAKQKKSKADELKARPRFSSTARTSSAIGGFKTQP